MVWFEYCLNCLILGRSLYYTILVCTSKKYFLIQAKFGNCVKLLGVDAYVHIRSQGVRRGWSCCSVGMTPCLPLESMTGMTLPLFWGCPHYLHVQSAPGPTPHEHCIHNVVISIPGADQKGSQRGWSHCNLER